MRNTGLEVSLNVVPVQNKNLIWDSRYQLFNEQNKLLSLSSDKYFSDSYQNAGNTLAPIQQPTHRMQEGEPIGNFYGYKKY